MVCFASNSQDCDVIKMTYWRHKDPGVSLRNADKPHVYLTHTGAWMGLTYNCFEVDGTMMPVRAPRGKLNDCHRSGVGAAWSFSFAFILAIVALACGVHRQFNPNLGHKVNNVYNFGMFCSLFSAVWIGTGITMANVESCLAHAQNQGGPAMIVSCFSLAAALIVRDCVLSLYVHFNHNKQLLSSLRHWPLWLHLANVLRPRSPKR